MSHIVTVTPWSGIERKGLPLQRERKTTIAYESSNKIKYNNLFQSGDKKVGSAHERSFQVVVYTLFNCDYSHKKVREE